MRADFDAANDHTEVALDTPLTACYYACTVKGKAMKSRQTAIYYVEYYYLAKG